MGEKKWTKVILWYKLTNKTNYVTTKTLNLLFQIFIVDDRTANVPTVRVLSIKFQDIQ